MNTNSANEMRRLYLVGLITLLVACEDLVQFPQQDKFIEVPVIEAILTDISEVQKIRVTYSVGVHDSLSCRPVSWADVRVSSSDGEVIAYEYDDNGWYQSPVFCARKGIDYTIEVTVDEITYKSAGMVLEMEGLDTLYIKYGKKPQYPDSAYYVYFDVKKNAGGNTGYYLIDVDTNGTRVTFGSELYIFQDKYMSSIKGLSIGIPFEESDTVSITLYSLSKDLFDYYFKLGYEVFSLNLSSISYQTNLPCLFEPCTPGYFQVSAVCRKEIVIPSK